MSCAIPDKKKPRGRNSWQMSWAWGTVQVVEEMTRCAQMRLFLPRPVQTEVRAYPASFSLPWHLAYRAITK